MMMRTIKRILLAYRASKEKTIFLADANQRAIALSSEDLMSQGLNNWRGWLCSAGVKNIFIDADGDYFRAACRAGGKLGNVFKSGNAVQSEWFKCNKSFCHCGADMQLRKYKSEEYQQSWKKLGIESLKFNWGSPTISNPVAIGNINLGYYELSANWDIGRRCNYACSYCHPNVSNQHERFRTKEELFAAADEIENFFARGKRVRFAFTGGEPTLNPHYLDLVRLLKKRGHMIHTQSNGSRRPDYYADLFKLGSIGISIHLESARLPHILNVVDAILKAKRGFSRVRFNWLCIRIMAGPGRVAEALHWRDELASRIGYRGINELSIAPLYERINSDRLQEYSPEEMQLLVENATISRMPSRQKIQKGSFDLNETSP